ncbi:protein KRI1 homolog isoform X2 [Macrobrachium rosenbergii]|uniref:protein KRI1 homolog isoform X2 n=1 Tax=Macrobrachium rosenbergii TaxID=79674 RepID=UPI0034D650B4
MSVRNSVLFCIVLLTQCYIVLSLSRIIQSGKQLIFSSGISLYFRRVSVASQVRMPKQKDIFDSDSGEEDNFKINEDYAERYDKWRYKEEYEKLKARADTLESSSDESSDEEGDGKNFGKPTNPEFDREFLMSVGTIYKHKTGDVDVKNVQFFTGDYRVEKEKKEKPMTLKDFERHVMVERKGKFEEDEVNAEEIGTTIQKSSEKVKFDDGLDDSDDDDGDGLFTSGLFKPKEDKIEETQETPKNEAVEFVKGKKSALGDEKQQEVLETLKNVWSSDKLSKKDKWLVDFFLNERYLGDDDGEGYDESALLDEEEMSEKDNEKEPDPLASQYKFRHQEPGDLIKRHPRTVPDSLRQKNEKRKARREAAKERQIQKKEEKRKEIELLKAMKYKEIEEKIEKIKEASGNEDIDLGDIDFEGDFDPAAHDAYMEKILGDSYYNDGNVEEDLPEFEDDIDDGKYFDNWTQPSNAADESHHEEAEGDGFEDYCDEDFNMDADYDPTKAEEVEKKKASTRRKVRHRSVFSKALEKKKPLFDPNEKDFASYFEEYYKLDFEDVVGGIPCRFKYRKVEANDFGLTTGEILTAQNCDLNKWIGLKKIMQYNRSNELESKERQRYRERAKHLHVKQKILPSLFDENPELAAEREREKRRLKNLKRKQKKWKLREGIVDENSTDAVKEDEKEHSLDNEKNIQGKIGTGVEDPSKVIAEDKKLKKKRKKTDDNMQAQEDHKSLNQEETSTSVTESPKKKKKKKNKEHKDEQNIYENGTLDETEIIVNDSTADKLQTDENMSEKKKKKKSRDQSADPSHTGDSVVSPTVEENVTESPKKKKKKSKETKDEQDIHENSTRPIVEENVTESPKKKKKKKSKETKDEQNIHENGTLDETEIVVNNDTDKLQTDENMPEKKKKKKKSRDQSADPSDIQHSTVNPTAEENEDNNSQPEAVVDQNGLSKSSENKSKHKNHKPGADEQKGEVYKKKKSKKHKEFAKDNSIKKKSKKIKNLKKMKHLIKKHKGVPYFEGISDARLEAYGQNPKKVKNRVFYGEDF